LVAYGLEYDVRDLRRLHGVAHVRAGILEGLALVAQLWRAVAVALEQPRADDTGAEQADAHLRLRLLELRVERLRHRHDGVLGDAVHVAAEDESHGRCGVDHPALFFLGKHDRQEGAHAVDHTPEVHAEGPVPVLLRRLPQRPAQVTLHAGVVEHEMHLAIGLDCLAGEGLHAGKLDDVGDHADDVALLLAQLLHRLLQRGLFDVGEHHFHALGGAAAGVGAPHTAGGAGNHRNLALEITHDGPPVTGGWGLVTSD